jgi:hypothetical protein
VCRAGDERDKNRKVDGEEKNDKSGKLFDTMVLGSIDP